MSHFLSLFHFTAAITFPIFLIVFLGWWFKRIGWLSEGFIESGSKLVFNLGLPALLFIKIIESDLSHVLDLKQLCYAILSTILAFIVLWWLSGRMRLRPENRGVFVQGAFRGNMGIIGLALCAAMYGDAGLAVGSILLAFLTLLYNILSVYALSAAHRQAGQSHWRTVLLGLAKNPLIITILAGISVNLMQVSIPSVLLKSGGYLADLTLPLALLCIGGSINARALQSSGVLALQASTLKLVVLPFLMTLGAYLFGMQGLLLGTLFLMFASPAATVGFIMAKAMRGNAELAATIITLSTVCSLFTISLGVFVLKAIGLV